MKHLILFASLILLFACGHKDKDTVEKSAYLDWGTAISDIDDSLIGSETMFAGSQVFINANETFNFEGLTAHDIIYGFKDSTLSAIKIGLYSKDIDQVIEIFNKKYGEATIESSDTLEIYQWQKDTTYVYMTYEAKNGKGVHATIYSGQELTPDDLIEIPMPVVEANPCEGETLYEGFRCIPWSTPFAEMSEGLYKSKNRTPRLDGYDKSNENYIFEGMKVHAITYCFKNNLYQGVNIGMYNKDVKKLVDAWSEDYGKPKVVPGGNIMTNYEWHLDGLQLTITQIHNKSDGKGVAVGILHEDANFSVRKPASEPIIKGGKLFKRRKKRK